MSELDEALAQHDEGIAGTHQYSVIASYARRMADLDSDEMITQVADAILCAETDPGSANDTHAQAWAALRAIKEAL